MGHTVHCVQMKQRKSKGERVEHKAFLYNSEFCMYVLTKRLHEKLVAATNIILHDCVGATTRSLGHAQAQFK